MKVCSVYLSVQALLYSPIDFFYRFLFRSPLAVEEAAAIPPGVHTKHDKIQITNGQEQQHKFELRTLRRMNNTPILVSPSPNAIYTFPKYIFFFILVTIEVADANGLH